MITADGNGGSIKKLPTHNFGVLVVVMECRCKTGKILMTSCRGGLEVKCGQGSKIPRSRFRWEMEIS